MIVERCWQAGVRAVVAIAIVEGLLLWPPLVSAQSKSLLDQGVAAAMYGRCRTDVFSHSNDLLGSAAALGAFAPVAVSRITAGADEITMIAAMCAHQIHEHRCTPKIVNVAGDILVDISPVGSAMPPSTVNYGSIVGGTVGVIGGAIGGSRYGGVGTAVGAGAGGYYGAGQGTAWASKKQAKSCIDRQQQLDRMSANLTGSVPSLSMAALQALIVFNVQRRTISEADADTLITEATKLSKRASEVLQAAMR